MSAMAKEQSEGGNRDGCGMWGMGTQEGESARTLCEPQINVSVWQTPSAGVGDTRPFAWSVMSARGRRRKRGAAAGAMLGRVWAARFCR